jgi:CheY-like chemotaxis protein
LRQVVVNLVENAAKYTGRGGRIAIMLEQRDAEAVLRVRDSGIGIATENLQRIFEPFTQSHKPLAHPSSGLGIGLTLVRRILELHGGHIMATSDGLGAGSEFVVTLPVASADTRDDPAVANLDDAAVSLVTHRLRKVMIVDDHEQVRKSVARLVRNWGHEVAIANDGASALVLADEFMPDFAIVDLSLPGMNGIELARGLRQRFSPAQLYLIAFTGHAGADIRDSCLDAGFDLHLVKPGDINLLEKLLGSDRAEPEAIRH